MTVARGCPRDLIVVIRIGIQVNRRYIPAHGGIVAGIGLRCRNKFKRDRIVPHLTAITNCHDVFCGDIGFHLRAFQIRRESGGDGGPGIGVTA